MTVRLPDPRTWLPAAVAALWFAARALPPAPIPAPRPATSVALPPLHGVEPPAGTHRWRLDPADTSVRFLVQGPRGELLARCAAATGELVLTDGGRSGTLALELDLGSLRRLDARGTGLDLAHVLGVHRGGTLSFRGDLTAFTRTDLPGTSRCTWLGTLRFGGRTWRQPLQTWLVLLPGRAPRLQGHGSIAGDACGLPRRSWFGLIPEHHEVTLGLDLGWTRDRGR